jgi:hypothetical protein
MLNEDTERAIKEAEELFKGSTKADKFSAKYQITPAREIGRIAEAMQFLADKLLQTDIPQNQDQLLQTELKRRLNGEAACLNQILNGELYSFDKIIDLYGIPREDIDSLRPWLEANKERTQEAIERLFCSRDIREFELDLSRDIPSVKRQADEFAGAHIQRYHKVLGKFLQKLTNVGEYLRDINAVPTTKNRSYFNSLTNTLGLEIGAICFSHEDGTLHIRDKEIIRLYGHEGMGHALNFAITKSKNLPYFLTHPSSLTCATAESVAQFYERMLIEDLNKSPETQRQLGIEHLFGDIYQDTKDTEQLEVYRRKLGHYGITILGDKKLGDPSDKTVIDKKKRRISEVCLNGTNISGWVERYRDQFDSEGNLNPGLVSELIYCAQPVERALDEFRRRGIHYADQKGRNLIDSTFLTGLWTPRGFVDNARLRASSQ